MEAGGIKTDIKYYSLTIYLPIVTVVIILCWLQWDIYSVEFVFGVKAFITTRQLRESLLEFPPFVISKGLSLNPGKNKTKVLNSLNYSTVGTSLAIQLGNLCFKAQGFNKQH